LRLQKSGEKDAGTDLVISEATPKFSLKDGFVMDSFL